VSALSHVPSWVLAVFLLLLVLGAWQARPRTLSPAAPAAVAAVMVCLSLYGVFGSFGAAPAPLAAWVAGMAVSVAGGARLFAPRELARAPGSAGIRQPGSWLPLGLMLGIFAARFAIGFAAGIGSSIVTRPWFAPAAGLVFGLLSGGFLARALAIVRFARAGG